jgi:hypothetical protein
MKTKNILFSFCIITKRCMSFHFQIVKEIESTSLSVILGSQEQLKVEPKKNKLLERYQSKFDKIFVSEPKKLIEKKKIISEKIESHKFDIQKSIKSEMNQENLEKYQETLNYFEKLESHEKDVSFFDEIKSEMSNLPNGQETEKIDELFDKVHNYHTVNGSFLKADILDELHKKKLDLDDIDPYDPKEKV